MNGQKSGECTLIFHRTNGQLRNPNNELHDQNTTRNTTQKHVGRTNPVTTESSPNRVQCVLQWIHRPLSCAMQRHDEQRGEIRKHSVAPRNQRDCTLIRTKKEAKKSHRSPFSIRFVPARSSHCQGKLASRRSGRSCALRGAQGSIRGTLAHEESALGHKGPGEGSQGFPPPTGTKGNKWEPREPAPRSHPAGIQFPVLTTNYPVHEHDT